MPVRPEIFRHIVIPALFPLAFFAIAAIPVEVIGCRNRGLLALAIVFFSLAAAAVAVAKGTRGRMRGEAPSRWWGLSALILLIAPVALIFLA